VVLEQLRELGHSSRTILTAHALDTSTDANLDHTGLDGIGNLDTGLKTRTALTVQRVHSSAIREAGSESGSTELSGTASRRQYTANSNILNQRRINLRALNQGFESSVEKVGGGCVFETSFASLGQRCAQTCRYDNVIRALLEDMIAVRGQVDL